MKRVSQVFELREYNRAHFSIILESEMGGPLLSYDQQQNPLSTDASDLREINSTRSFPPKIFVGRIMHLPVRFLPALEFLKSDRTRVIRLFLNLLPDVLVCSPTSSILAMIIQYIMDAAYLSITVVFLRCLELSVQEVL
ncbi:hypothetical protein BDR06DRAFT_953087 [Suillus hirtellus]|nr:hypothetical protein BDR06DRAFT_953087 [Suillus hirtellus]